MSRGFPAWMEWVASRRWGSKLSRSVYTRLDKAAYRLTGGRRGLSPKRAVLYLTTTGRRTGKPRRVPILFLRDGDRFWVVASNYGQEHHPAWSANLLAEPQATVQIGDESVEVKARLATAEEKTELWPRLLQLYPAWREYVTWTDRDFRLFCLEPRRGSST